MSPPLRRLDQPLVAVLEKRGRFLVAEPLFGRGPRGAVDPRGAGMGDLVLVGSGKRGARVIRRLGRPDRARDVLEGLMLDRGLHRNYPRSAAAEAEHAASEPYAADARVDLTALPTFTIDPDDARDFDDAISAVREDDGRIRVWVHIADVTAYLRPGGPLEGAAYRRGTSVYVPGRGRADAAGGALEPGLLAAPGRGAPRGDRRDGDGRRRGAARSASTARACAPTPGSPTARSTRSSPAAPAPRSRGRRRSRRRARWPRRCARAATRSSSARPSPSSTSTPRAT